MPVSKVKKIKKYNVSKNNSGQIILKKRSDCGTKNLVDYITDKNNLINIDYLSDNEKEKLISELKHSDLNNLQNVVDYVSNNNKCFDTNTYKLLIDAINCDNKYNAAKEFIELEKEYHRHKIESCNSNSTPNEAFHIIQSFKGTELNPEKVHEIGLEFAKRLCGTSFKSIVTTHMNTNNYHNHIAICAYALDGYYKFKDEWNIGLKLQKLSDELALENGIEIITEMSNNKYETDDEKISEIFDNNNLNSDFHFNSIGQYKMYKSNTLNIAKLKNDIVLTARESNSFEEYEKKMNLKGYSLIYNAKSISYQDNSANFTKDNKMSKYLNDESKKINKIRDNRLGQSFTKATLIRYFNNKIEKKLINNYESQEKIKTDIYKIKPKKCLGQKGNIVRVSLIFQILEFLLRLIDVLLLKNDEYTKTIPSKNIILIKAQKGIDSRLRKLKALIEKAKLLCEKYNIQNINSLKIKKNQVLRYYCQHRNQVKNKYITFRQFNKIDKALNQIEELEFFVRSKNLSDKDLLILDVGEANILENKAKIDPMTPQTKSRLYKAMHNSNYKLKYKFNQITEAQAKEICYFMSNPDKSKKPETLYHINEYLKLKKNNELFEPKHTPNINNLMQPDLSEYNKEDITKIKLYKKYRLLLNSFGLTNESEIKNYLLYSQNIKTSYINLERTLLEEKDELKNLQLIEDFLTGNINEKCNYFNLFEDNKTINSEINKYLNEEYSLKEQLITLKTILDDPYIKSSINMLDNENIIIAPSEVLSVAKTILACKGTDIEINELLNYDKSQIKEIIIDFIKNFDIKKYLENELKIEIELEKQRIEKQLEQNTDKQIIDEFDKELTEQTEIERQQTINKIIDSFTKK